MGEKIITKGVEEKIRFSKEELRLIEKHRAFIEQDKDFWAYSRYKPGDGRNLTCSAMAKFIFLEWLHKLDKLRMEEALREKEEGDKKKENGNK